MILLLDNFDSFVYNLARYFQRLGQTTEVVRSNAITPDEIAALQPKAIVISPGPCTPNEAGCSLDVVRRFVGKTPILGVCLGHQAIAAALGGRIVRAAEPVHGRASPIEHSARGLFEGLPNPLQVGRYHSLVVEKQSLPAELEVTATTGEGVIMAVAHRAAPVFGVQFHPESILTDCGYELLSNFLRLADLPPSRRAPRTLDEHPPAPETTWQVPLQPVTF